jgi:peptide/nickel transport system ATP-binding protein
MALLDVKNLKMYFETREGPVHAVDDISFGVEKGSVFGLVGESGSGKTSIALTVLGLLPPNAKIMSGSVRLEGQDLLTMPEEQLRKEIRWKHISLVAQGAMNSLNPVFTIGDQIREAITAHTSIPESDATGQVKELLRKVGIAPDRYSSYPHEFSGGMKQRVIIAMALALSPDIVIADEPTTALDVIVQAEILTLLKSLQEEMKMSMILITHDLSLVAEMSNTIAIAYGGQTVESGSASTIFHNPRHPYTIGLLKSVPNIDAKKTRLISIPGSPPDLVHPPTGCRFAARCAFATSKCVSEMPRLEEIGPGHSVRCWYWRDMGL